MTRHYYLYWRRQSRFACGGDTTDVVNNLCDSKPSEHVNCAACRASEVFLRDLAILEIGFSGNREEWCMHMIRLYG